MNKIKIILFLFIVLWIGLSTDNAGATVVESWFSNEVAFTTTTSNQSVTFEWDAYAGLATGFKIYITTPAASNDNCTAWHDPNDCCTGVDAGDCYNYFHSYSDTPFSVIVGGLEVSKTVTIPSAGSYYAALTAYYDNGEADTSPPVLSALLPSGQVPCNDTTEAHVTLTLTTTDQTDPVTCAYSTSDVAYASMTPFTTTGGTSHSEDITGLACSANYTYYVRCADSVAVPNVNLSSGSIIFQVASNEDTDPPTILTKILGSDGRSLTLTFSEPVKIGSGGNAGWTITPSGWAATVSYSSGAYTSTLVYTTSRPIYATETLTITYVQPTDGVEDNAGNDLASITNSAVTNNSIQLPPSDVIWPPDSSIGAEVGDPTRPVELGLKFSATEDGRISAIWFYKTANNTGTHIGNLWDSSGRNLASVTFSGETATGWQEMLFPHHIPIYAGVTYIISYFVPAGYYVRNAWALSSNGVESGYIIVPQSVAGNYNGVYLYSPTSIYPSAGSSSGSNYWLDIKYSLGHVKSMGTGTSMGGGAMR
jgi:hypothetical protein